jgi:hypothetical protein
LKKETARYAQSQRLTVLQANILLAMLVGFWGRTGDGHPGPQILAEGLRLLQVLVWFAKRLKKTAVGRRRRGGPT